MKDEKRLEEVEVKLAFQEDLLAKLDEALRTFIDEVGDLRREVNALREAVDRLTPDAPEDDPPPHY